MWIASTLGWFSIVTDSKRPGRMLVRARCRQDILNLYDAHAAALSSIEKPTSDESRDYRWRMSVSREDWIVLAGRLAAAVDYSNFKSVVHDRPDQGNKSMAYMDVWRTMYQLQLNERPESLKPSKRKARSRKAKNVPDDH
jgi:hypothetical protein